MTPSPEAPGPTELDPAQGLPAELADRVAGHWRSVSAALTPIVGERGMQALFRRSLQLQRQALAADPASTSASGPQADNPLLQPALMLHQTFVHLLQRLIGESLADRLMPAFPGVTRPPVPPDAEPESAP